MKRSKIRQLRSVLIASAGLLLATASFFGSDPVEAQETSSVVRDVALQAGGVLNGRVTDRQGKPLPAAEVVLLVNMREIARARSDSTGGFRFAGVRPGPHQVRTTTDIAICRLWATATAPPAAHAAVLLRDGAVIRGQCGCRPWRRCNRCCGTYTTDAIGTGTGTVAVPEPPSMSMEELREFAPDLPEEQFAALTMADVVITNPDHISMVISYDSVQGTATVVAKGGDDLALQIQELARNAGIPVVQNVELAQALYAQVGVGQMVPEALLGQVIGIVEQFAVTAPAFEPTTFETFDVTAPSGQGVLIVGGIIAAAVVIPIVATNEEDPHSS